MIRSIPTILRADKTNVDALQRARELIPIIIIAGMIYGGVMGSFGGMRCQQILVSAIKVPILLGISFALTVPSFFVLNTLLGLREDFRFTLRAVAGAQAGLTITLASLSPFVALWYASCSDYSLAVLFNGFLFAIATVVGHILLRRYSRELIRRHRRHRTLMRTWMIVYALVAIQMAWVLRPFVGEPSKTTTFFRHDAWGNAYTVIWDLTYRR